MAWKNCLRTGISADNASVAKAWVENLSALSDNPAAFYRWMCDGRRNSAARKFLQNERNRGSLRASIPCCRGGKEFAPDKAGREFYCHLTLRGSHVSTALSTSGSSAKKGTDGAMLSNLSGRGPSISGVPGLAARNWTDYQNEDSPSLCRKNDKSCRHFA